MKLFGWEITKKIDKKAELDYDIPDKEKKPLSLKSFADPMSEDGSAIVSSATGAGAGYYSHVLDLSDVSLSNEADLVLKYRAAAAQPECDLAISDIVNGAIISDTGTPVNLNLDKVELAESVKKAISNEFDNILKLLNFNFNGHDIFRRWYIDGKLYYHMMIDNKNPKLGIKEIRLIDPLKIKKVKEVTSKIDKETGVKTSYVTAEYYLYSDEPNAFKVDKNSVVYVPSGIMDDTGKMVVSYLHKSIKLVNQLRIMEDSLVIYRIARAPERRIFYIDVGNLPKGKAEEYVQGIMAKYRNKLVYNANTGEITDDRKTMSMLEDFWLPRREGGKGTEITTLPGGENLSSIDDVLFFQKKLYRSLNVPTQRLENDKQYEFGRVSEISREEVKFQKFINRLRLKFSLLFTELLKIQCTLKGVCTLQEWPEIQENIEIDFVEDNYFTELKEFEIMRERMAMMQEISEHIGTYYSKNWVRKNILNQSEKDIEDMNKEIKDDGDDQETDDDDMGGLNTGGF